MTIILHGESSSVLARQQSDRLAKQKLAGGDQSGKLAEASSAVCPRSGQRFLAAEAMSRRGATTGSRNSRPSIARA